MRLYEGKKVAPPFNTKVVVFVILSVVSFLLLFFSTSSFVVNFRDVGLSFFSGMRNGVYRIASAASATVFSIRELAVLQEEYAELTSRMTRYEQLERNAAEILMENKRLREQLGFSASISYHYFSAEIIGRDPDNLFSALIINKGTHDGVSLNMPVIAYQSGTQGLVGKIVQTGRFESLVMPLYDRSSFVSSRFSASRYEGIVEGQGSQDEPLIMRFIQKRARDEIGIGDVIISSGLGGVYPPEVNVGRVSDIQYYEDEISMEVRLETAVDFSRLEHVFVLDKEEAPEEPSEEPPAGTIQYGEKKGNGGA
jgi:rod shape-determining protein MreC